MKPQRLKLCRHKGFNLQAASLALNGLPAVNCARPGYFGNPFKVTFWCPHAKAVALFEELVESGKYKKLPFPDRPMVGWKLRLRGHNLACWCRYDDWWFRQ